MAQVSPQRQIFRQQALQQYTQQQNEQNVQITTIPTIIFVACWAIFFLVFISSLAIGSLPIPYHETTSGIVLSQNLASSLAGTTANSTYAVIFIPVTTNTQFKHNQVVTFTSPSGGATITGHLDRVESTPTNAATIAQRFTLRPELARTIPSLSIVGIVKLDHALQLANPGRIQARYEVGTIHILSLLLSMNQ